MSQTEFEKADAEVIGIVNSAAAPEAMKTANAIEKKMAQEGKRNKDSIAEECVSKVVVEELQREWKRNAIIACGLYAIAAMVAAIAMVIAMKKPECMVYVANATVLICGIVAALKVEKIIKILRRH